MRLLTLIYVEKKSSYVSEVVISFHEAEADDEHPRGSTQQRQHQAQHCTGRSSRSISISISSRSASNKQPPTSARVKFPFPVTLTLECGGEPQSIPRPNRQGEGHWRHGAGGMELEAGRHGGRKAEGKQIPLRCHSRRRDSRMSSKTLIAHGSSLIGLPCGGSEQIISSI